MEADAAVPETTPAAEEQHEDEEQQHEDEEQQHEEQQHEEQQQEGRAPPPPPSYMMRMQCETSSLHPKLSMFHGISSTAFAQSKVEDCIRHNPSANTLSLRGAYDLLKSAGFKGQLVVTTNGKKEKSSVQVFVRSKHTNKSQPQFSRGSRRCR
jgi:hypothetical protein